MQIEKVLRRVAREDILHEIAVSVIRAECWHCPGAQAVFMGVADGMLMEGVLLIDGKPNKELASQKYGAAIVDRTKRCDNATPNCIPGNSKSVEDMHTFS
ncbi:hypothetical protein BH10PAT3_BH10PAT3_7250 [soil metagenome]